MNNITAIIPFASYDSAYFKLCIDNLLSLDINVVVVSYNHLWSGEEENYGKLKEHFSIYNGNSKVRCFIFDWEDKGKSSFYWEANGRWRAISLAKYIFDPEYLLLIDIDEIVEPEAFYLWLKTEKYKRYKGMKLRNHMYFIDPTIRLKGKFYNVVMCRADYALNIPFKEEARLQYFNNSNKLSRWTAKLGINPNFYIYKGEPFIHHFTGVRTRENMIKKVTNWGHKNDRTDWMDVINNKFKVEGDRIGEHRFEKVDNIFNIETIFK